MNTTAIRTLSAFVLFGMIVWLAVKDWLTSSTTQYPYVSSLSDSLSIVVAALAAYTVVRVSSWRNFLLGVSVLLCLAYLRFSFHTSGYLGILPSAGVLACALAFPWPVRRADRKWFSSGLIRRCYFIGAAIMGFTALILSYDSNLLAASLVLVAIIGAGYVLRSIVRSASNTPSARIVLASVYAICFVSYWVLSFVPLLAGSDWSLLGDGLGSGGEADYHYCSDSLFEGGLISATVRCIILTVVLSDNAGALLDWSRIRASSASHVVTKESREAMELSVGVLISMIAQVVLCPLFAPTDGPDPASTGYWILALSLASLCIATRSLKSAQGEVLPVSFSRPRIKVVLTGLAIAGVLLIFGIAPLIIIANNLGQGSSHVSDPGFVLLRRIPVAMRGKMTAELPYTQAPAKVHDLIRQSCGASVNVTPSLCTALAYILTSHDFSPGMLRTARASILGWLIGRDVEPAKVLELYLNERDYGAPTPGLQAASAYYFHKPVSQISLSEATYLLSDPSYYGQTIPAGFQCTQPGVELASQQSYTYTLPAVPSANVTYVHHDGTVNGFGQVVGTAFTQSGTSAYTWGDGRLRTLASLEAVPASSFAISNNNLGQIVGWSYAANGQHAVLWDANGTITDLGTLPGYPNSVARSINNKGQVVGYAFRELSGSSVGAKLESPAHAFLWQSGKMTDLGTIPGCTSSRAYAINDSGQIAGWVLTDGGSTHAMVCQNGIMHDIGTLGGQTSIATAINSLGQVVGSAQRYNGTVASFVWQAGVMHDIGTLESDTFGRAWAINDLGQIVGLSYGNSTDLNEPGGHPYIWDIVHGMRPLTPLILGDPAGNHRLFQYYTAFSINNQGEILGLNYLYRTRSMFLLKPVAHPPLH